MTTSFEVNDRWLWHAYDYAWRRVYLSDFRQVSPIDLNGEWFDEKLVEAAETYQRGRAGRAYNPGNKPEPSVIRDNWRKIRSPDLTDAEHQELSREAGNLSVKFRKILAEVERAAKSQSQHKAAPSFAVPQSFVLPAEDDPAVQRILNDIERHAP